MQKKYYQTHELMIDFGAILQQKKCKQQQHCKILILFNKKLNINIGMSGQMKEALPEQYKQYSIEDQPSNQYTQPTDNFTFPKPDKQIYPPESFDDTEDTSRDGQSFPLTKAEQELNAKKQRAKILRERAGLLTNEPPRMIKRLPHNKWGNFLVLYDGDFSITLGPDCNFFIKADWCFIPTFICFTLMSIAILSLLFAKSQSIVVKIGGLIVCGGQLLAYLLMATSNPGIAKQEDDEIQFEDYEHPEDLEPMKICGKCGFSVPKCSYHCRLCDVCILGYDHHCPWTSKCIGKNNLCRFYTFLAMTPLFLVFIAVAFVMVMSEQTYITHRKNIRNLFEPQNF